MKEHCKDCQYWQPEKKDLQRRDRWLAMSQPERNLLPPEWQNEPPTVNGSCRRHAPRTFITGICDMRWAQWLITNADDGCGDFKPNETQDNQ